MKRKKRGKKSYWTFVSRVTASSLSPTALHHRPTAYRMEEWTVVPEAVHCWCMVVIFDVDVERNLPVPVVGTTERLRVTPSQKSTGGFQGVHPGKRQKNVPQGASIARDD